MTDETRGLQRSYKPLRRAAEYAESSLVERIPPQDIESEMAVIGALLLGDGDAVDRAAELLTPADFYREAHERIFEAMLDLWRGGEPVDIVTLKSELARRSLLDVVGGVGYLMQLADFVPTTANVAHYADRVRQKSVGRALIQAASEIAGRAYAGEETAMDQLAFAERIVFAAAGKNGVGDLSSVGEMRGMLCEVEERIEERERTGHHLAGLSTGFWSVDRITNGLKPGEFIVLGGRPSMGKSAAAMGIALNVIKAGGAAVIFSLEMPRLDVMNRLVAAESGVPLQHILTGRGFPDKVGEEPNGLSKTEWALLDAARARLWDCRLRIDEGGRITPSMIRSRCRRLRAEMGGLDLVVIDYLQIVRPDFAPGRRFASRYEEMTEVADAIQALAKELKVPVIALAQLSREVERREDKRPLMSDLRDSGGIEAAADIIALLYRPSYYERKDSADGAEFDEPDCDEVEILVEKNRNGKTAWCRLDFYPNITRFTDYNPDKKY